MVEKSEMNVKTKIQRKDIIAIAGIIGIVIFSIWKAKYGFGGKDVSFYLNIPYRMVNGDILFWDEWNLAQLSSFLLYPMMKFYMAIMGTTEAIILHFRYIYIMVNAIVAMIMYSRLRRYGNISVIATAIYAVFSPFNHTMLSYNSLGMMFGFLGVVLLATSDKKRTYFLGGLCYAIATLCQPLLALLFVVASLMVIVYCYARRKRETLHKWMLFTSACIILSIPVFIYFITNIGIEKLLLCFPGMTMDLGIEHSVNFEIISLLKSLLGALLPKTIYNVGGMVINTVYIMLFIYIAILGIWILYLFDRIKKAGESRGLIYIKALCILSILASITCCLAVKTNPINIVCFPWIFPGIMAYFHLQNKSLQKLFRYSVIWGVLHMISYLTSNGGAAVFSVAWFPNAVISIMVVYYTVCKERGSKQKINLVNICIAITLFCLIFVRGKGLFHDDSIEKLTREVQSGPGAGLWVSEADYLTYTNIQDDLEKLDYRNKKLLLLTERTWAYLFTDIPLSQYSTYFPGINSQSIKVLKKYYDVNKDKKPDLIYIPNESLNEISIDEIIIQLELDTYKIEKRKNSYVLHYSEE